MVTPTLWIDREYLLPLNTSFLHIAQQLMDHATSPRKATSPKLAPVKVSTHGDDDDTPISAKPKTPVVASPKAPSVKPPSGDEDDKPLSAKTPKVASPKAAAVAKTPKDDDDDKPIAMKSSAAATLPAVQPALSSAPPSLKPSSVTTPDLQSILNRVKALAAQSSASKSSGSALSAPTTKRPKVLHSSDEDDDKPLSSRASSSAKPQSSSASKQHSSSSSKHHSSHSSHDKKKREHDVRSSPSKSRNSSALLGDAGSEFKSVGHVFLSSDRSHIDKLIAGILSRWWYGIEWPPSNYQPTVDKTWKPLVGFSFVYEGPDGRIHNIRDIVAAATKGAATVDPRKVNIGPPTYDNLAKMGKSDLKVLLLRCLENQIDALKESDPQFHGKNLIGELNDFKKAVSCM